MSFGISVGDIILCTQITHRLFSSVTKGRKRAPQDLKELQDALFGLYCALNILEREHETFKARTTSDGVTTVQMNQHLGYMIRSCQNTLQELDIARAQYREAIDNQGAATSYLGNHLRIQWKRIMWSLRGDTFIKYRQKLQMHTDSLHLLLSTFLWSVSAYLNVTRTELTQFFRLTTSRIEESGREREQRLNEHFQQASEFNMEFQRSVHSLQATIDYTQRNHFLGPCVSMCLTG